MKQILLDNGWWMYHSCTCGGSYKEKYKHPTKPNGEIHIRPNQNKWFYVVGKRVFDEGAGANTLMVKIVTI